MTQPSFISAVQSKIEQYGLSVEEIDMPGQLPNLVIENKETGAKVLLELQDAKSYGELPLSTAIQLKKVKQIYPNILLVSLSEISNILGDTLTNMGISFLVKPSAADVSNKINEEIGGQQAIAAS